MIYRAGFFLAVICLLSTLPHLRSVTAEEESVPGLHWRTDYAFANLEARTSGKPLFVVFRCER